MQDRMLDHDAGTIEQYVDFFMLLEHCTDDGLDLTANCDIDANAPRVHTGAFQFCHCSVDSIFITRSDPNLDPGLAERSGHGETDSTPATGNKRDVIA